MARMLNDLSCDEKKLLVGDILNKKNGVSDVDWSDIVDTYDLDIAADTLRKAGVGIKLAQDAGAIGCAQTVNDPNGYAERQMMRDLVNENNKVYRAEARDKALAEAIEHAVSKLENLQHPISMCPVSEVNNDESLVIALGDIHFGEEMEIKDFFGNVINKYDESVFYERMGKLMHNIKEIFDERHPKDIHVMLVGDAISGMLRQSQLQNLRYGIVDSTIKFSEYFATWIDCISCLGIPVNVHIVGGNHDEVRPLGSKAGEFPKENMAKIIAWYLEERLNDNRLVSVLFDSGRYHYVNVQGFNFLMLHGDGGKIQDICRDAINVYGHKIDYFVCGHLHHEEEINIGATNDGNSVVIRVPSMCGMDGYAQKLGRFSKPGATAMIIRDGYGRQCVYPIVLN